MIQSDLDDVDSLALCAWKEARGEGATGCVAVMNVIANRVGAAGFAHTLHDVIYGKNQFTSMSVPNDPEFNLTPSADDAVFLACKAEATTLLAAGCVQQDVTNGAHYYANLHNVTSGWFYTHIVLDSYNHPITAQIGHHTFFK